MRDYVIGFLICWGLFGCIILAADTWDLGIKINNVTVMILMSLPAFIPAAVIAIVYGKLWSPIHKLIDAIGRLLINIKYSRRRRA